MATTTSNRFIEIITESNNRHYFPVRDIQHLTINGKTVDVFPATNAGAGFVAENVSNIDDLVLQMQNTLDYHSG